MRILITAGPTWERVDAVRYIGNRSSGKLGVALSQAAAGAGHTVTLLAGPQVAEPMWPDGCETCCVHRFESCDDLRHLVGEHFCSHDVLVMAAAVADYRPSQVIDGKRPRQDDEGSESGAWDLRLVPTPDLVEEVVKGKRADQRVVSFALEDSAVLEQRALAKLVSKGVDGIVANPLETIGANEIQPVWIAADGSRDMPGRMDKSDFAYWLMEKIKRL